MSWFVWHKENSILIDWSKFLSIKDNNGKVWCFIFFSFRVAGDDFGISSLSLIYIYWKVAAWLIIAGSIKRGKLPKSNTFRKCTVLLKFGAISVRSKFALLYQTKLFALFWLFAKLKDFGTFTEKWKWAMAFFYPESDAA